jgi:VanZ family protein
MLNTFKRALTGELPLWRVFWLGHILGYFILIGISALITLTLNTDIFFKPVLLLFILLSVYAIYKCSANVEKKYLGKLAKIYAVLIGLLYIVGVITIPIALYL